MASVLTRRFFITRIIRIKEFSTLAAYPYANIFNKLNHEQTSRVNNRCLVKFSVLVKNFGGSMSYSTDYKKNKNKNNVKKVEEKEEKLSLFQKFKIMYRDYWYVLVPVHLVTSAMWFGGFYFMAKSGFDIVKILESWHVSERFVNPLRDSSMGYYAVSYALYKISTPARYTVTLGGTTISINYLKKWGYIKPVPSKERIKEIYEEKKQTLSKSVKDTKEGIKETKENIIETVRETKEGIIEKKQNILENLHEAKEEILERKDSILGNVKETKDSLKKNDNGICKHQMPKKKRETKS